MCPAGRPRRPFPFHFCRWAITKAAASQARFDFKKSAVELSHAFKNPLVLWKVRDF